LYSGYSPGSIGNVNIVIFRKLDVLQFEKAGTTRNILQLR
jgi:hypothetical protein